MLSRAGPQSGAVDHGGILSVTGPAVQTVEAGLDRRSSSQDLWIGRVGRRYRLISRSAGKVWLCQISREGSSG